MTDIETLNQYYEQLIEELDSLIDSNTNSLYKCVLYNVPPNPVYLPHVQHSFANKSLGSETLDKREKQYPFEITIEIYSENQLMVSRRTIGTTIENFIAEYMINERGLKLIYSNPILNMDTNVHRILMKFSGTFDIENKIIYRY